MTLNRTRVLIFGVPRDMFSAYSGESDWEWAQARRKLFKTPQAGVLTGPGTGVVSLVVRPLFGDPSRPPQSPQPSASWLAEVCRSSLLGSHPFSDQEVAEEPCRRSAAVETTPAWAWA